MAAGVAAPTGYDRAPASKPATWHHKPRSEWNFAQRVLVDLGVLQVYADDSPPPVFAKTDPVPVYPVWRQNAWILPRVVVPLLVHRAYMDLTGNTLHPAAAFFLYTGWMLQYGRMLFAMLRRMGQTYGFVSLP